MPRNPILDEIHAARRQLLQDAGGDLHRYIKESTRRALESGQPIAKPTRRKSIKSLKSKPARSRRAASK